MVFKIIIVITGGRNIIQHVQCLLSVLCNIRLLHHTTSYFLIIQQRVGVL